MADYANSLNKDTVNNLFTSARYDADNTRWMHDSALWHKNAAGILVPTGNDNPLPTQLAGSITQLGDRGARNIRDIYNGGLELTPATVTLDNANAMVAEKLSTYIHLKAQGGTPSGTATASFTVDVTDFYAILVDWEQDGTKANQLIVNSASLTTANGAFSRRVDALDVSSITGSQAVKVVAYPYSLSAVVISEIKIYGVWGLVK